MNNPKILKTFFTLTLISTFALSLLSLVIKPVAAAGTSNDTVTMGVQVPIPNSPLSGNSVTITGDLLGKYIIGVYNYGLAIVGILAAIVLMAGGVLWLISGGDPGKINQAKELMVGSVIGTIILFSAWIILNTVNPALLQFKPLNPVVIQKIDYCCDQTKGLSLPQDGKCTSGQLCSNGAVCTNNGHNSFSCVDPANNTCCQYSFTNPTNNRAGHVCVSTTDKSCQVFQDTVDMVFDNSGSAVKVFKNYYCGAVTVVDKSADCDDLAIGGDCSNVNDGKPCKELPSGITGICYNQTCFFGSAKTGEACGGGSGFTCMAGNAAGNCSYGYSESTAPRHCSATGEVCCKKN